MRSIIVLGMHRSGTSALTRAIGALGAEMGPSSELRKNWENLPLRQVNEQLLTMGQGTWDAPPSQGWLTPDTARPYVYLARSTLEKQFGSASVMVWKDPRTCVTLPFWLEVLVDPVFVLVHRHPSEVTSSLQARNNLGPAHCYAIWERYNADALRAATGHPTVVLAYDRLVTDPEDSLAGVRTALADFGVELPHDPATTDHGLRADARHHTSARPDAIDPDLATASQQELFGILRDLPGSDKSLQPGRSVPDPHPISVEVLDLVRRVRLQQQRRQQRGEQPGMRQPIKRREIRRSVTP